VASTLRSDPQHGPEDFRRADVWPGVIFGKTGTADFRDISQSWLRDLTQAWCWDNLNRSNNFHMFGNVLNEINYFSDYLRANAASGGTDITAWDRSTITGFAAYLSALVEQSAERYRARRNRKHAVPWSRPLQHKCLLSVQRILRYGRETGRLEQSRDHSCSPTICSSPWPRTPNETRSALPCQQRSSGSSSPQNQWQPSPLSTSICRHFCVWLLRQVGVQASWFLSSTTV
jgi:hypothetical protein